MSSAFLYLPRLEDLTSLQERDYATNVLTQQKLMMKTQALCVHTYI